MGRREQEELPIVVEEPTPEGLTSEDPLGLGYEVGGRYENWTHKVDLVLGYTEAGCVVVRGESGRVRIHLTPADYGSKRVG